MAIKQFIPNERGVNRYLHKDGHSLSDSLNEIIDNARDQGATEVNFKTFNQDGRHFLAVYNNGKPVKNWDQFITLGGIEDAKRPDGSIGHYGVGLKQYLSRFENHSFFSKNGNQLELQTHIDKKGGFYYDDVLPKNDPQLTLANKLLKKFRTGVLILVEVDVKTKGDFEDLAVFEKSAEAYYYCADLEIFLNDKRVVKKCPFGKVASSKTIPLKNFPEVKLKYIQVDSSNIKHEIQGCYVLFNGRLVNTKGRSKYFWDHATYNGHLLLIEVNSWNSPILRNDTLKIMHQKNSFELDTNSPFYSAVQAIADKLKAKIKTEKSVKKEKVAKVKGLQVLQNLPTPKGLIKTDQNTFVNPKKPNLVVGSDMKFTQLDQYLKENLGYTLSQAYGGIPSIESGRFFKADKKMDVVIKLIKPNRLVEDLKALFYDLEVLEEFGQKTKISTLLHVRYVALSETKELKLIKNRLQKRGVKFK